MSNQMQRHFAGFSLCLAVLLASSGLALALGCPAFGCSPSEIKKLLVHQPSESAHNGAAPAVADACTVHQMPEAMPPVAERTSNDMATYEIVGDDDGQIARQLMRAGMNPEVIGAIAAEDPALASALDGVKLRKVNVDNSFGIAANICLPLSLPGVSADGAVLAAGAILMTGKPNRDMKARRLIIETSLPSAYLTAFSIQGTTQFLSTGAVPCSAFSPLAIEANWDFSALKGGLEARVDGINGNAATNKIFGSVYGQSTQS